jgi:hypothetical protein
VWKLRRRRLGGSKSPWRTAIVWSYIGLMPSGREGETLVPPRITAGNGVEPLGFEDVLWKAADKLRRSMDGWRPPLRSGSRPVGVTSQGTLNYTKAKKGPPSEEVTERGDHQAEG